MKRITLIFFAAILAMSGCKTQQNPEKAAIQELEDQLSYQNARQAIDSVNFVLQADKITFKSGQFVYVNTSTNFISVKNGRGIIQLAFNGPYSGPNGIGGITVEGSVSSIKKDIDKKGNISFSMSILGNGVSAQVFFYMTAGSNICSATVTPNFNSQRITFTGKLYPPEESDVFKGRSL